MKEITVLCKVVDNFGDIGVVWRLCKCILEKDILLKINLIVDDLFSFSRICKDVEIEKNFQIVKGINVYNWKRFDFCYSEFHKNDGEKLQIILECFQCGRPDWMEKILFEDKLERTVNIIMIDYLTAEDYAQDFHCLKSLTRSAKVQKVNFMPGFTERTGGLIIDNSWKNLTARNPDGPILFFTYERQWSSVAKAVKKICPENQILIAQGRGLESLQKAFSDEYKNSMEKIKILEYMNQNEWDEMTKTCSVLFIRGEESMSRACLSGIPFVWHAYPQSDEYQLVKVQALLKRMSNFFSPQDFSIIEDVWLCFNKPEKEVLLEDIQIACEKFLQNCNKFSKGFEKFALELRKNGDLCDNLMTFINKLTII